MRNITLPATSVLCCALSSTVPERTMAFPKIAAIELGQIDKLIVRVSCGRVSSLRDIPELYNIEMRYEIPTENIFEAEPRLGAAAVELSRWNGVIAMLSESDGCFAVKVEAQAVQAEIDVELTASWDLRNDACNYSPPADANTSQTLSQVAAW